MKQYVTSFELADKPGHAPITLIISADSFEAAEQRVLNQYPEATCMNIDTDTPRHRINYGFNKD